VGRCGSSYSSPGLGPPVVDSITSPELAALLEASPVTLFLLDVREDEERAAATIEPSTHIPMNSVPDRLGDLPRDRRIVVFCHHGNRSYAVASYLESEGFEQVTNLTGGIDEWSRVVDPSVPRY
jgi:rhodanese-related sulfurtransferase